MKYALSLILLQGSATARKLEGDGGNNCTGNYSIKWPIRPPRRPPSSFFSLSSLLPVEGAEAGGSKSSLGLVLCDPVIWLDTQLLGQEQGRL